MQSSPASGPLSPRQPEIAGNACTGLVKIIAVFFMLIDHSAILFFRDAPFYTEMRLLGRIALPLFAWGCAVGCVYTRNIRLYALRVALAGFAYQFLYMPVMHHDWSYLNIFFTLALGITAVAGIREGAGPVKVLVPAGCLLVPDLLSAFLGTVPDYSWKGVLLVICLYLCRRDRAVLSVMFTVFCLYWGSASSKVTSLFGLSLAPLTDLSLFGALFRLQGCALLALPVILWRPAFTFRIPKWISYAIYPAHLVLLWGIGQCLG